MIVVLHPLQVRNSLVVVSYKDVIIIKSDNNDFNNTNITLVFEPDEESVVNEKSAPVLVIDDDINEATEQVFIVELRLVSSVDPTRVDFTTRPSSLCRIIDNHDCK